jgi:hypothetical protein
MSDWLTMDAYLERNIKDLLADYPAMGDVLNAYNIGCVTCTAGSCALKDIVRYHYLPEAQQHALMDGLAQAIAVGNAAKG